MAELSDLFGAKDNEERIDVNGMCEQCYWPVDYGLHDKKTNKLKIVCVNGHETMIDWNIDG